MIGHFIGELYRTRQRFLASRLADVSVSINATEFSILMNLFHRGPLSPKELEELLQINKSNVTRMVKSLEAKGVINTTPSSKDRRSIIVSINPGQKQFIKNDLLPITEEVSAFFTQKEMDLLRKMVATFKKEIENESFGNNGKSQT